MFQPISKVINLNDRNILRTVVLPVAVATVALATAIIGALIIGSGGGIDGVNGFVESLSGGTSRELGSWGLLAPLGFAFALGMVSAVNPCGFAMLPAYLGLYLGDAEKETGHVSVTRQFRQAMVVGGTVTVGFAALFGVVGFVVSLGAGTFIRDVLPVVGLAIGVILALLGSWMVGGGKLYTGIAARAVSNMGDPAKVSLKGYFIFGISYATASLSCTIGLFMALVGTSLSLSSIGTLLGQFFLYAHHGIDLGDGILQDCNGRRSEEVDALRPTGGVLADGHRRDVHSFLLAHNWRGPLGPDPRARYLG